MFYSRSGCLRTLTGKGGWEGKNRGWEGYGRQNPKERAGREKLSKNGQKDKAKEKRREQQKRFYEACLGVQATRSGTWETSWEDCEAHKNTRYRSVVY